MFQKIAALIASKSETVIDLQRALVSLPALGPDNQGDGEWAKGEYLQSTLSRIPIKEIRTFHAKDPRVSKGLRPNIAAILPGKIQDKTLWIIGHMDVVPPGDTALWNTDPFTLHVDGDTLIGRGVEDNQQSIVSALLVLKAFVELGVTPNINFGLLCVSDEETGNAFGLEYVLKNHSEHFKSTDLYLVPDFGTPTSEMIEVAEKSLLWFKVTVTGRQCHASTPEDGKNSLVAAADLILKLRSLYDLFPKQNNLFSPPFSTFEPTKKEANVPNVNTIPGQDVFYIDCRVLSDYSLDEVTTTVRALAAERAAALGVTISVDVVQALQAAPETSVDCEIVHRLTRAIDQVYGVKAKPAGIGGITVASLLRHRGYPAAVWETLYHNAHQPNERASISHAIKDAQVLAHILLS